MKIIFKKKTVEIYYSLSYFVLGTNLTLIGSLDLKMISM